MPHWSLLFWVDVEIEKPRSESDSLESRHVDVPICLLRKHDFDMDFVFSHSASHQIAAPPK